MMAKTIHVSFLIGIFLISCVPLQVSADQTHWWNTAWSFRQEIVLGLNTNDEGVTYQPVDLPIRFNSLCWVESETTHSIRMICQSKTSDRELESQIYDLVFSDTTHITSCNLVFLVPPQTDGSERYYLYYDDSSTASPGYPDYVSIEDSSYYYEPIPGYPLESHYYKISQNNTIRYVVAQEGQFLWYTTSQYVTKLREGSTEVIPKNGEVLTSFEFVYYYAEEMWEYNSTSQKLISADILCDGNLMVSCKIISRSIGEDLQTTAVYKYFYCPASSERIQVHVVHEALKDCLVYPASNTDGTYASIQCGGIKSASIADLNFGEIYPYYHFYSEQNVVEEYQFDLNPDYNQEDPVIRLIQTQDDVDLGKNAWISFDEGATGDVHALIFGSSSVVKEGVNERDGMQLKAYESDYPHLPGLDYTVAAVECSRNAYEKNVSGKDTIIPQGFVAEFDAEFFSSPVGGYPLIEKEAGIFQVLVPMKPLTKNNQSGEGNTTKERFSLMIYVHNALSLPFGSALSAITGRFFPYISIEVYRDNELVSSGTAGRLPIKSSVTSEASSLREIFSTVIRMIDFRNLSLFKRFHFQGLEEGRYLIKIFRENPKIGKERRFIGFMVVDLTKDSQIHIFCKQQGTCVVSLTDQQGSGIHGAEAMLIRDGLVIAQNRTNADGKAFLTAPYSRTEPYQLRILYHGFEVVNESIHLRYSSVLKPLTQLAELDQYDWALTIVDLWGLPPEIDLTPQLTSPAMKTPTPIFSTQINSGTFEFSQLLPASYHLQIQYKSFVAEQDITIPSSDESLVFPAVFPVSLRVFDSHGIALVGNVIQLSRGGKTQEATVNGSRIVFSLPPGQYVIKVLSQGSITGQRSLTVMSERNVDLITIQEPIFPLIVLVLAGSLLLIALAFSIYKKTPFYVFIILIVGVLVASLLFPWWSLQGSTSSVETSSTLFMFPLNLISTTQTSEVIAGEFAFFPEIFTTVMMIIVALTILSSLLVAISLIMHRYGKQRWQSILLLGALILLVSSLVVFIGAMSAFTEVGVGSFIGQGTLDISIQGEEGVVPVGCQWGPGVGFWLYVIASLFLISTLLVIWSKKKKKR